MTEPTIDITQRYQKNLTLVIEDGPEYEEKVGYGRDKKTHTCRVVSARLGYSWNFEKNQWRGSITLYNRWVLKSGELGANEYIASTYNRPELQKLANDLLEKYHPRTVVSFSEVSDD